MIAGDFWERSVLAFQERFQKGGDIIIIIITDIMLIIIVDDNSRFPGLLPPVTSV